MSWTVTRVTVHVSEAARARAALVQRRLRDDTGGMVTSEWTTLTGIILAAVVVVGGLFTAWIIAKAGGVFG